jgi:hypothetical protein
MYCMNGLAVVQLKVKACLGCCKYITANHVIVYQWVIWFCALPFQTFLSFSLK